MTLPLGSKAHTTKSHALVTQGGMAPGLLHAGPSAQQPTSDAAAADTIWAEALRFATALTAVHIFHHFGISCYKLSWALACLSVHL